MLTLLSSLSTIFGIFALISPKTPIAQRFFNKIGISNTLLDKYHSNYNKIIFSFFIITMVCIILSACLYWDYTGFVGAILYLFMFLPIYIIIPMCFDRKITFLTVIKSSKIPIAILSIPFLLLSISPSIYNSKEMTYLYQNLKNNNIFLHTLISNKNLDKEEFANKYDNIIKLTSKAQILQDYERYYQKGISFTCNPKVSNSNHSKAQADMFKFLCNNFDKEFKQFYLSYFKEAIFKTRIGLPPEIYPPNWLNKLIDKHPKRLSRLILNIRLIIGNGYLFCKKRFQSILDIIITVLIITVSYFLANKLYKYNKKYDEDTIAPKFIFYAIWSITSIFTLICSVLS